VRGLGARAVDLRADARVVRERAVELGLGERGRDLEGGGGERVDRGVGTAVDDRGDPAGDVQCGLHNGRGVITACGVELLEQHLRSSSHAGIRRVRQYGRILSRGSVHHLEDSFRSPELLFQHV
jgi:hypothetical protein